MNHLRLLLHRQTMVTLSYDVATGRLCGELAIDIVRKISQHDNETSEPSSFRFHMATSLGGAILILATLLVRPVLPLGLEEHHTAYAESFRQGLTILRKLTVYLQAARRIANDLEDIIHVVLLVLNQSLLAPRDNFAAALPTNMDDLFPYTSVDFAQQSGLINPQFNDGHGSGDYDGTNTMDSWDTELQPLASNGYGVPWL